MDSIWPEPLNGTSLRALFEPARPLTIGIEEELMVLDRQTLNLLPRASTLLEGSTLDERFKTELPASHLEIATHFATSLGDLAAQLWEARRLLAEQVEGAAVLAASGVHPFAARAGELSSETRYEHTRAEYGIVAKQELVCGVHVHIRLSGADRVLAVYNELRGYLPEISALAANAPVHAGQDTGMASIRPIIAGMLPRQGVPPALENWDQLAGELFWGRAGHRLTRPGEWWWELRPHVIFGTLEVRVPDAQVTVADTVAVACVVAGLAVWLAERYEGEGLPPPALSWRINENRWSAARHGLAGQMADLRTGRLQPTRDRLYELIEEISPTIAELGGSVHMRRARELLERNGAQQQREIMAEVGARGLTAWLVDRFLDPIDQ